MNRKTNLKSIIFQYLTLQDTTGWLEDERMAFWPMLSYPDICNFLMFYPSELGSKDLSDYNNSKVYTVTTNQDGFNLCHIIIFQEVNIVSSEENVENLSP